MTGLLSISNLSVGDREGAGARVELPFIDALSFTSSNLSYSLWILSTDQEV